MTFGVQANEIFCCQCGRPVPVDGEIIGRCGFHPEAKRTRKNWLKEAFAEMHRVVDEATGPGKVIRDGKNYWTELEDRAAREQRRLRLEDLANEKRLRELLDGWNAQEKI